MSPGTGHSSPSLLAAGLSIGVAGLMCLGPLFIGSTGGVGSSGALSLGSTHPLGVPPRLPLATHPDAKESNGPHPGTLEIWEDTSGPETVDPSVCYYTVCDEPISNVYETLIAYNGTDDGPTPNNYVPQLATCVPGSLECAAQFGGNELVWKSNSTGDPEYYTFEIDASARFYDPGTGVSWPVYPSDVLFTFARTMGFSDLLYEEQTNGWINTQDLVPAGNHSWDGGIHAPLNNTPQHILDAFLVNDSAYCPVSVTVATNGCITFNLTASGHGWPFFLELVADNMGASIEPCGWYTFQGASVPGFLGTNGGDGDGPCLLPGNTTSTSQSGYQDYVRGVGSEGWDTYEEEADNFPSDQPAVQWNDVGSGPYYIDNPVSSTSGYTLAANPAYVAPVGCAGQLGCLPDAGSYIANVDVVWAGSCLVGLLCETGLEEMEAGQVDSAGFFQSDTGQVLNVPNYSLLSGIPSLDIGFFPFDLTFNLTSWGQGLQDNVNVPGNFLDNVALRQFLVNSYPYATIDTTYDQVNNTLFGEPYGGAIPHNMSDYYPTNITWPSGNPVSSPGTVGNVAWWWAEANDPSSPLYDPELASCTSTSPCFWPTISFVGDATLDDEFNLWNGEIVTLSGGNLTPYVVDWSGNTGITDLGTPPGQNPMPVYNLGWAPDYPDPSDYMAPIYSPDNVYTWPDAVSETLQANQPFSAADGTNSSVCPNDYGAWSNLTYWAGITAIPQDCQGAAYDTMVAFMNQAQFDANVPQRAIEYNLAEQIANKLALYVYDPQTLAYIDYGDWIEPSSINTNPMLGGEGVQLWYDWSYVSNYFNVTFEELGLANGTNWNVTVDGTGHSSGGSSEISISGLGNGTYQFEVGAQPGLITTPARGNLTIAGSNQTVFVTFIDIGVTPLTLQFHETGLPVDTPWSVALTGEPVGTNTTVSGNRSQLTVQVSGGEYAYTPGPVPGFATPPSGVVDVTHSPTTVDVNFNESYPVMFDALGLRKGTVWSVTLGVDPQQTNLTEMTFLEPNGTYPYSVHPIPGMTVANSTGTLTVHGAPLTIAIAVFVTPAQYELSFREKGLPDGATWSVSVDGLPEISSGSTIRFTGVNGTYSYVVGAVAGYTATLHSGSVALDGLNRTVTVTFVTQSGFFGLSSFGGGILLVTCAIAVGAAVYFVSRRTGRSPSHDPPPTAAPAPSPPGQVLPAVPDPAELTYADRWRPSSQVTSGSPEPHRLGPQMK
jgi:hypothetical protein